MTDDPPLLRGHERQQRAAIGPQRIDDVAFLVLTERAAIHLANGRDIFGLFRSDVDHVVGCPPNQ